MPRMVNSLNELLSIGSTLRQGIENHLSDACGRSSVPQAERGHLQGGGRRKASGRESVFATVPYPDVIAPAARAVASGDCDRGVVLGGSGTGEQIVANKVRGIRCVEAADPVTARLGRQHNDANMLSMGARIIGREVALACVDEFMTADFEGGRHERRVDKIRAMESDDQR